MERRADTWYLECKVPQYFKSWVEFTLQRQLQEQRRRKAESFNLWAANEDPNQAGWFPRWWSTSRVCFAVFSVSGSTPGCFTPGGDSQRSTRRRCCLSGWYASSRRKPQFVVGSDQCCAPGSLHRVSGRPPRGAISPTGSLDSVEAAHTTTDRGGRETGGVTLSLRSQASPQNCDTVEEEHHRDAGQVRMGGCCRSFWSICTVLSVLLCSTTGGAESCRPVVRGTCAAWDQL